MHVIAHTCKQPPQAVISMAGYGLTRKQLQPARLRNLYGGLQLRETTAAYGGGFGVYLHVIYALHPTSYYRNPQPGHILPIVLFAALHLPSGTL